ncbi:acyl-CoA thioesterase [Kriegella aquimaris]|uniref:Acyl-CoA thioester hydrolase n=1 Tax=Kriegella aquimaris TaxID=192904 RepID=A0A1G9K3M7_9FLAO|nr:acyl-CoA thioesterase [Kriegella aquimaris]SDL44024.1 acyl-CoA thioester hydrolase [Kriegella aquimaris]
METYNKTITVMADDLDELDHVNNVRYVQWIQDISKEHWLSAAPPEMQKGVIWVVMNHNITYKNSAKLNDVITIKTHIAKSKGATSTRVVEMYLEKTNQLLLHSVTTWCLLNNKTLKPTRISETIKKVFMKKENPEVQ